MSDALVFRQAADLCAHRAARYPSCRLFFRQHDPRVFEVACEHGINVHVHATSEAEARRIAENDFFLGRGPQP